MPKVTIIDIIEIFIIAVLVYYIMAWIKNTKVWSLMRGIIVILAFVFVAYIFQMNTILWIVRNVSVVAITAVIVVFQPELRKALETLGRGNVFMKFFSDNKRTYDASFTDDTIEHIVKASYEMGRAKTGALMVIERGEALTDYERTGILVDAVLSCQLLVNIFEHNTPLHDGAVVVRGNRVVAATCYLPLSTDMGLSKELGTRHRAGVGVSEATDSITVIVSEETGRVSVAFEGSLKRNVNADELRKYLSLAKAEAPEEKKFLWWKPRRSDEENNN